MIVLAMAGVSGTGKTKLLNKLETEFNVDAIPETTRGEVLNFCNLPLSFNTTKALPSLIKQYDASRLEYQVIKEQKIIKASKKEIIIFEKSVLVYLMYLLTLTSRWLSSDEVDYYIGLVQSHVKVYYDKILYFPAASFIKADNNLINRNFTDKHLLEVQDSVLYRLLKWLKKEDMVLTLGTSHFNERLQIVKNEIEKVKVFV